MVAKAAQMVSPGRACTVQVWPRQAIPMGMGWSLSLVAHGPHMKLDSTSVLARCWLQYRHRSGGMGACWAH